MSASAGTDTLAEGRAVYNFRCYYCHGYSGNARTLAATFLQPPPADFTRAEAARLTIPAIEAVLRDGRPGTAMKAFTGVISEQEIQSVARFVYDEFVQRKAENTRYHTDANGWPDHARYQAAYPFALGQIALTTPWETLTQAQQEGKRLYMESCVSCHDRGSPTPEEPAWDARPLSYPRKHFSLSEALPPLKFDVDAVTSASPYAKHEIAPQVVGLNSREQQGKRLFEKNCAFCHGADGTGKNWIGQFLEPHPRNLQDPGFMAAKTREDLQAAIAAGLPGSSMPAWKSVLSPREIQSIIDYIARAFHPLPPWQKGNRRKQ
jgi:cytochrome c oxidase cbb3-type subunit 3